VDLQLCDLERRLRAEKKLRALAGMSLGGHIDDLEREIERLRGIRDRLRHAG
jgi:hypothetical protein